MHNNFIEENELLDKTHEPVQVVFFDVGSDDFIAFVESLCNGIGWGGNFSGCYSWDNLDEYEKTTTKKFYGIRFETIDGQHVIISYKQLYYYIKTACIRFMQMYPNSTEKLNSLLKAFRQRYIFT